MGWWVYVCVWVVVCTCVWVAVCTCVCCVKSVFVWFGGCKRARACVCSVESVCECVVGFVGVCV